MDLIVFVLKYHFYVAMLSHYRSMVVVVVVVAVQMHFDAKHVWRQNAFELQKLYIIVFQLYRTISL